MQILIVSATIFEIAPLLKEMNASVDDTIFSSHQYNNHQIDVLITGVGMTQTGFYLGKHLSEKYNVAINAGICGSFNYNLLIGDVLQIEQDCFADLGAEDDDKFISIKQLNLPGSYEVRNEFRINNKILNELKCVKGVTVNTTHGNTYTIAKFMQHTKADTESMEGAAFLWACNQQKIACAQIRSVSNYVEKRDRLKWNIPLAIENLNKVLLNLLRSI